MTRQRSRKCLHCGRLFRPDPRNRRHQRYCSEPACRKASKAASQARWLAKASNRDYFRGPAHVERVQRWREDHPGYWKRPQKDPALQDSSGRQATDSKGKSEVLADSALQDVLGSQAFVLVGLIANLTGSALQEDIAITGRRLLRLGYDIVQGERALQGDEHGNQTGVAP